MKRKHGPDKDENLSDYDAYTIPYDGSDKRRRRRRSKLSPSINSRVILTSARKEEISENISLACQHMGQLLLHSFAQDHIKKSARKSKLKPKVLAGYLLKCIKENDEEELNRFIDEHFPEGPTEYANLVDLASSL